MDMYLFFKALHLVAMVAWFAGVFYLPRLFVYRSQNHGAQANAMLDTMARRLSHVITAPAALVTWGAGMALVAMNPAVVSGQGWLHAKLLLVVVLSVYYGTLEILRQQLADGSCTKSERFFRLYNEVPTLILLAVVFLAVLRPF